MAATVFEHSTPAGVVADAGAQIGALCEVLWAARPSGELVDVVQALQGAKARIAALEAQLLTEVDARGIAKKDLGWAGTADWFTHLAGLRTGQGRRAVEDAHDLTGERAATMEALRCGSISPEQAVVILAAVDRLPTSPRLRLEAEVFLIEQAAHLDATALAKVARHLVEVVDPDRAERDAERDLDRADRAAHLGRFLAIVEDGAGGVRLRGRGTVEDAAVLRAALLPLTAPTPAVDPETCEEGRDPRDHGARMWDAMVELAQHSLSTDLAPDCHGARPRVTVATDLDTLRGQLSRAGHTDDGLDLAPSAVRRLACDADLVPVALGSRGEVLDLGRTVRLVGGALWRALVCRDRHCAFPGCTRPPVMCHGHHIVHWADGGATSLGNTVLLCGHHHRTIHLTPWEVRISAADGRPEFRPPPRRDAGGGPPPDWVRHRPRRDTS